MTKKRILMVLCSALLVLSLAACGEKKAGETKAAASGSTAAETERAAAADANPYGLDYDSEEIQPMSDVKVERAVLKSVSEDWLGGNTMFIAGMSKEADYTYEDFVEKIGAEANTYNNYPDKFSESKKTRRQYTWLASDEETAKFSAFFEERDGKWLLYGVGSVNL